MILTYKKKGIVISSGYGDMFKLLSLECLTYNAWFAGFGNKGE